MQAIFERNKITQSLVNQQDETFGIKIGLAAKLFGCRHKRISRPLTIGNTSYRACLQCGARKQFDTRTLKTYGSFYYPPAVSLNKN